MKFINNKELIKYRCKSLEVVLEEKRKKVIKEWIKSGKIKAW